MGRRRLMGSCLAALAATQAVAGAAAAWGGPLLINAVVWGHTFSQVEVESSGCVVTVKLEYSAPDKAYRSRIAGMNHYRFKTRARFASGRAVTSHVFASTKPGRVRHSFRVDTKAEGCWARQEQQLRAVDVEGCRGEQCAVEPFK